MLLMLLLLPSPTLIVLIDWYCIRNLDKGLGMLNLGRTPWQTWEKFVYPTAMSRQMRDVLDF